MPSNFIALQDPYNRRSNDEKYIRHILGISCYNHDIKKTKFNEKMFVKLTRKTKVTNKIITQHYRSMDHPIKGTKKYIVMRFHFLCKLNRSAIASPIEKLSI